MNMAMLNARAVAVGLSAAALVVSGCNREKTSPEEAKQDEPEQVAEAEEPEEEEEPAARAFIRTMNDADLEWGPCPEYMPEGCGIAVLQGDPTQDNADIFFRMAPGTTVPEHWHTSNERMVLVSGTMVVDYDGQEPVELQPGTYAYGPGGLPHETQCAEGDDCVLFIAFEDPVDAPSVEEQDAPGADVEAFITTVDGVEWGDCPEFLPEGCGLAVLQGDPAEHNADVFFRLAPGTTAPNHWHTSAERMVLISGEFTVDYEGHDPVVLHAGTYAYGPAELPHEAHCADGEECVLFIAFEENVDAVPVE
jgi:quercetin dioxygenase-like cupin family protein